MADAPPLHPDLEPIAFLLGAWRGEGSGHLVAELHRERSPDD